MRRILVIGFGSDTTTRWTVDRLRSRGCDAHVLDLARFLEEGWIEGDLRDPPAVRVRLRDESLDPLGAYGGIYVRLITLARRPGLSAAVQARTGQRMDLLAWLLDQLPGRVVNRPGSGLSNSVKPFQALHLRRFGLDVPSLIATNDPSSEELVVEPSNLVFKSNSSIRSIVQRLTSAERGRLERLTCCPVLFQRYIEGPDVRVHVVGERCFALGIESSTTDYRYAPAEDRHYSRWEVPEDISSACRAFMAWDGVSFAGIDFKVERRTGRWYVLESNPMPGYEGYDRRLNHAISDALLDHLTT